MRARAAAALLLVALAALPASAQVPSPSPARTPTPKRGGGLWGDAGIGYGRLRLTCATCPTAVSANGTAVTVSAGFTPARNVLLGLQAQRWSSSGGQKVSSLLAMVQWYPWPATGFFVRAGNGIRVGTRRCRARVHSEYRRGVRPRRGVRCQSQPGVSGLTVQAATHISALGDLTVNGQPADDVIAYVTRLGVAVVVRSVEASARGLPLRAAYPCVKY